MTEQDHTLLDDIHGVIFDLDGVLYIGETVQPGAADLVRWSLASGRRVMALTNNARNTPAFYHEKLRRMGMEIPERCIMTSALGAAMAIKRYGSNPGVFVAGAPALHAAVREAGGIRSENPDVVVVGMDILMPLSRLESAGRHVMAGAGLIVTNKDPVMLTEEGPKAGTGAAVAFVETMCGQQGYVAGKPNPDIFERCLEVAGLPRSSVIMVGDSPASDIVGARGAGLRSVLVAADPPDDDGGATLVVPDLVRLHHRLQAAADAE